MIWNYITGSPSMLLFNAKTYSTQNCYNEWKRATDLYEVTLQRYGKSHTKTKLLHACFMTNGFKILREISNVPFKISYNIFNHKSLTKNIVLRVS